MESMEHTNEMKTRARECEGGKKNSREADAAGRGEWLLLLLLSKIK